MLSRRITRMRALSTEALAARFSGTSAGERAVIDGAELRHHRLDRELGLYALPRRRSQGAPTCRFPGERPNRARERSVVGGRDPEAVLVVPEENGRASCRERV